MDRAWRSPDVRPQARRVRAVRGAPHRPIARAGATSYSSIYTHRAMVFDDVRNRLYANALRNAIGPHSVVLDLGAGLGTHGLIAATAGARRVYCVEPQPVIRILS